MEKSVFELLNSVDCNGHTEQKNGLTYLSWAWAWAEAKKRYPSASYTVYENPALGGMPYFTDGTTCMVKTGVTIEGLEHIEYLPVMDYKNRSIPASSVTSFDINKSIQRSLTKALARHGLGLYIYAGEDLPESAEAHETEQKKVPAKKDTQSKIYQCEICGKLVTESFAKKSAAACDGHIFCSGSCKKEFINRK